MTLRKTILSKEIVRKPTEIPEIPTIGITYDTRDDFYFTSDEPDDWDAEFAVSMAIDDITNAIEDAGYPTVIIGSGKKLLYEFASYEKQVNLVFNIAEGKFGRSRASQIPAMLEMTNIPFVGSDAQAITVALDKNYTKIIAQNHGIRIPEFTVIENINQLKSTQISKYPVITKLTCSGSSIGIGEKSKIYDFEHLIKQARYLLRTYKQPVLIERFITGPEIDVPIIGNSPEDVFGITGITLDEKYLSDNYLTSKIVRQDGYGFCDIKNQNIFDCDAIADIALKTYSLLGCRDFGRVDMRIDESDGKPYLLEINTYPYLGKHSSFSHIANRKGMKYKDMIKQILDSAISRYR